MSYEAVIGLEIHAELKTRTKLFCSCSNEFGGAPNSRICPVCTGQPGTLPSTNREAIRLALRACLAFGCKINRLSAQCRKHYFYPDLPKGYQISQRETPLGVDGSFEFLSGGEAKRIGIHQIHIEEDAGKLVHRSDAMTGIDYNRAGVPLIEIVTEPELHSAEDATAFLEAVRLRLMRAGVSDCRMEQGALRCDVNVSLRKKGDDTLNERVEMKNINTFSGARRAIEYEIERQKKILNNGGEICAETRKWDDEKRESRRMRTKESAIDYKFMPDPDIPCYDIDEYVIEAVATDMPEDDVFRTNRYEVRGVSLNDCERIVSDIDISDFFDKCLIYAENAEECAKMLVGDVVAILTKENITICESKLLPQELCELVALIIDNKITRQSAKKILSDLITKGGRARDLATKFESISDDEIIKKAVSDTLSENKKAVCDYKNGKQTAVTYLMGQCMRRLSGRADAEKLKCILINELKGEIEDEV